MNWEPHRRDTLPLLAWPILAIAPAEALALLVKDLGDPDLIDLLAEALDSS